MIQVLHTIRLKGGAEVELLATPALFGIAKRKGMTIEADADNMAEVYAAYTKMIYLAAMNAWEVRRYDDAGMGDFPYKLMDFVEWASNDAEGFVKAVNFVLSALTRKDLKDYAAEGAKPSENAGKPANAEDAEVKKKVRVWMDYEPIESFLVGRCGKGVREAALTSLEEFELLAEGHRMREREEWERTRWMVFMEWSISPNLKRRPHTPQDVIRFPWEKETAAEVKNVEPLTENEIQELSKIFGINRESISNG